MNKDKRYLKTEQLIRNNFYKLLDEKRYSQITIDKLCEETMISKNTFYAHYKNKDELVDSIINELVNGLTNLYTDLQPDLQLDILSTLSEDIDKQFDYINEHFYEFQVLFKRDEEINFSIKLAQMIKRYNLGWMNTLIDANNNKIKTIILLENSANGLTTFIKSWITYKDKITLEEIKELSKAAHLTAYKETTNLVFSNKE